MSRAKTKVGRAAVMGSVRGRASSGARAGAGGALALATVVALLTLLPGAAQAVTTGADLPTLAAISTATAAAGAPDGSGVTVATFTPASGLNPSMSALRRVDASAGLAADSLPLTLPNKVTQLATAGTAMVALEYASQKWDVDIVPAWGSAQLTRTGIPGQPVDVVASASDAYVELANGDIWRVPLAAPGSAALLATVPYAVGGLAVDTHGGLYAAAYPPTSSGSAASVGSVVRVDTSTGHLTYRVLGSAAASMKPTALVADGTYVYVAGSTGLATVDPSTITDPAAPVALAAGASIWLYPSSSMSCGDLALDSRSAVVGRYLFCAPLTTTDLNVYRFVVGGNPLRDGLTEAKGIVVSKHPTAVWGQSSGGAFIFQSAAIAHLDASDFDTAVATGTFPQPVRNVIAAPVALGTSPIKAGIQVNWTEPAFDADDVLGYSVSATVSGGSAVSMCFGKDGHGAQGEVTPVPGTVPQQYTCTLPPVTAGKAYTISVQATNAAGPSTPVQAPPVNAGTPSATVGWQGTASATCPAPGPGAASSSYVVPTYTVARSGTAATAVTLTWPEVKTTTCDPFTGHTLSNGVAPTSFYVLTAIDAVTGKAGTPMPVPLSTVDTASGIAKSTTLEGAPALTATLSGLTAGKSYLFTVAANNSPLQAGAATPTYAATWTGAATFAVPDQTATTTVAGLGTVKVMDPAPTHLGTGWDYIGGGVQNSAYLSQVDLYGSSLYRSVVDASATVDPSYVAATPTPVKAVSAEVRSGAIQVSWTAPDNFGSSIGWGRQSVKSYLATARYVDPAGKVTAKTCTVTGVGASSCPITGLTNGIGYQVFVQAMGGALGPAAYVTADGVGTDVPQPPSYAGQDPAVAPALVMPVGLPAAPTAVKATIPAVSPNSAAPQPWGTATVTWVAPVDNGGRAITGYRITAVPTDPTVGSTLIGNQLTAYLCKNPSDPDLTTAASFTRPLAARTKGADALDISDTTGADLSLGCDTRPSATWGSTYTFPKGSLSSQTGWSFKVAAFTGYHDTTIADPVWWGADSSVSAKVVPNGAPMAPTKVTTTVKPTAITASWTAPTVLGGWPLAGYQANLYRYDGGSTVAAGSCRSAVAVTSCSVPVGSDANAAADGGSYFFMVQAYNQGNPVVPASNESTASNTVAWYDTPDPVLAVDNAVPADKSIYVSWTAPGSQAPGKDPITAYTASATAGATTKTCTVAPPGTSCNITGLTDGTPYLVSVTESNPGATSKPAYFTGIPDTGKAATVTPGTAPAAPASVGVSPRDGGVDVWWTAPKSTGGAVVEQYVATVYPGGESCTVEMPGPLACAVEPLTNGVSYVASVVAVNTFGTSPASASSPIFVPFGLPREPLNVQAFPQDRTATVTWEAPADNGGKPLTSYQATAMPLVSGAGSLRSCTSGNPNAATTTSTTKTTAPAPVAQIPLTCEITGLTNGVDYVVYVTATNAAGRSGRSAMTAPFRPTGSPDAPTGVVAYTDLGGPTAGTTTLHVGWNPSINDGGSPLVSYTATASNGKSCTAYGGETWCDIHGLTAGVKYTVSVTAVNTDGYVSPASVRSQPSAPAGPPTAPSSVVATGLEGGISIKWAAGKSHGAPITLYVVTLQPTGDVIRVPGNKTSIVVHDLDPALTYRALVQAESGPTLVSGMSRISNAVRPFLMPARMAKPKAKAVKTKHGYKVIVGWKAPAAPGNPITGYLVKLAGGAQRQVAGTKRRAVFTGLKARHRYAFVVIPIGRFGQASASPAVVVRTRG